MADKVLQGLVLCRTNNDKVILGFLSAQKDNASQLRRQRAGNFLSLKSAKLKIFFFPKIIR